MNLIYATLLLLTIVPGPGGDSVAAARRIVAGVQLAAEEYRNGVAAGKITAQSEVDEARSFLTEAKRSAHVFSPKLAAATIADIDRMLALVAGVASADAVAASARQTSDDLATALGVVLDPVPEQSPSLARGSELFRSECSSCHGESGRGDGAAGRGLTPPPVNLTDAGALRDATPLSFYLRITIGVAATAMPAFESRLPAADRWALALYASTLRQAPPAGNVPAELHAFSKVARLTDSAVGAALGGGATPERIAAVRAYQADRDDVAISAAVFTAVRAKIRRSADLAAAGRHEEAADTAFDAYLVFEQVETSVRAKNATLASALEAAFATLRTRVAGGATPAELVSVQRDLAGSLEQAERVVSDRMSPVNLFVQSLVIMLREGLEAILIIGALIAFLMKAGAAHRKRDIHIGVGAAVAMSLLTAVLLETVFVLSAAHREALEGWTMIVAVGVLFYVSYWLLSKIEVAKWTSYVKERMQVAVTGGSAFALASAAFLAVYREGFETVLFYKALLVEGGALGDTFLPVSAGIAIGGAILSLVYIAINRWGVKLPLKPFFGLTSAFLYYMAFVFAGKGVAELQDGLVLRTTALLGWPRVAALGIYPTVESMVAQGIMALLAVIALLWIFVAQRGKRPPSAVVASPIRAAAVDGFHPGPETTVLRSLDRMEADLGALKSEVERLREAVVDKSADEIARG
jgi:high-affinity iron transporter